MSTSLSTKYSRSAGTGTCERTEVFNLDRWESVTIYFREWFREFILTAFSGSSCANRGMGGCNPETSSVGTSPEGPAVSLTDFMDSLRAYGGSTDGYAVLTLL